MPSQFTYFEGSLQYSTPLLPHFILKVKLYGPPNPQQAGKGLSMSPGSISSLVSNSMTKQRIFNEGTKMLTEFGWFLHKAQQSIVVVTIYDVDMRVKIPKSFEFCLKLLVVVY